MFHSGPAESFHVLLEWFDMFHIVQACNGGSGITVSGEASTHASSSVLSSPFVQV